MIGHVVMFRWTPEATDQQKQRVTAELSRHRAIIAESCRSSQSAPRFSTSSGLRLRGPRAKNFLHRLDTSDRLADDPNTRGARST
jgi:hypothetical protein